MNKQTKGTEGFSISNDALATARTSPITNFRHTTETGAARPVWPFTHADALAYFEATAPGGEFNDLLATWAVADQKV